MDPRWLVALLLLSASWQGGGLGSAQSYNQEAVERLEHFDFNGAVTAFQAAQTLAPTSLTIRVNLGLAFFYAGDFGQARLQVQSVLEEDPEDSYAQFLCGVLADREGDTDNALRCFQTVLRISPDDPGTYYHLGLIALREERSEEAVELFEKSLAGNPVCTSSLYNLGRALILSGKREEGQAVLERFQRLHSEEKPGMGGGMGDPSLLVGKFGQPRRFLEH